MVTRITRGSLWNMEIISSGVGISMSVQGTTINLDVCSAREIRAALSAAIELAEEQEKAR